MANTVVGFPLIFAAAICGGAFALPMKFIRRFQWESTWLWGSFFVMVMIPWIIAAFFLPNPLTNILAAGEKAVLVAVLFGVGWGFGTVTFGLGVSRVGLSLGYAIIMGVNTAAGSLLPLIVLSPGAVRTSGGRLLLLGIGICILGVATCGYPGILKGNNSSGLSQSSEKKYSERLARGTNL